jgi:hypothetical protein
MSEKSGRIEDVLGNVALAPGARCEEGLASGPSALRTSEKLGRIFVVSGKAAFVPGVLREGGFTPNRSVLRTSERLGRIVFACGATRFDDVFREGDGTAGSRLPGDGADRVEPDTRLRMSPRLGRPWNVLRLLPDGELNRRELPVEDLDGPDRDRGVLGLDRARRSGTERDTEGDWNRWSADCLPKLDGARILERGLLLRKEETLLRPGDENEEREGAAALGRLLRKLRLNDDGERKLDAGGLVRERLEWLEDRVVDDRENDGGENLLEDRDPTLERVA